MSKLNKKELIKLSSFFTMGDGGVYKYGKTKHCQFLMNMKKDNLDYIEWVADVLSNITKVTYKESAPYNNDGYNRKPLVRLWTNQHPYFDSLRERIYTDNYKGIDPHALKLLDAESLAILYMCDGSLYTDKPNPKKGLINNSYNVNLNMKRLSYGDQFILKKALKEKLDLEWNINRHYQYYYLRLRNKDLNKFMDMIEKYIKPSFNYKLITRTENSVDNKTDDEIVRSIEKSIESGRNDLII